MELPYIGTYIFDLFFFLFFFSDFKRFLLKGTPDEIGSEDEEEEGLPKPKPPAEEQVPTDEAPTADTDNANTEGTEASGDKAGEVKEEAPRKFVVEEPKEDASERAKRRKSMLYGYTAASSIVSIHLRHLYTENPASQFKI